eukprot:CAMPEP_0172675278 /NCGR_PEP_ID=MMETSP1074-20121228/13179_1 /TAXON_ID=2916 /ORGANISM="Ceratium fusus, Strain PA161109" /LENGTH=404 /DNA_ID=CAMNT_0013492731 /DNA_START=43 /DNA_END=1257 /DNA_ORIENTATION=+
MTARFNLQTVSLALVWFLARAEPFSFLTIGDWGAVALGSYHVKTVMDVAEQMGKTAADSKAQFVVNVGDNFYYCGIQNTSDKQIEQDYTSVYTAQGLQVPWYSALGNHEYGYNVQAQVDFTKVDPTKRWYLPARYYMKRIQMAAGHFLTLIVLDTNPCISAYRASDPSGWDPCSTEFPDFSPIEEGPCRFNENILEQDCGAQYAWLQQQLQVVDKSDWLIIVGHHPADEINVQDFVSVIEHHGFDLYLNGHVHDLEQYSMNGNSAFVTSGAGGMVHTQDQSNDQRCVGTGFGAAFGKSSTMVWKEKKAGFTLHTFNEDFTTLKTEYISSTGDVIHSFTVKKGSKPGPTPKCRGAGAYPCFGGCKYVHTANERKCGVKKYGCYDCSTLSSGCPECEGRGFEQEYV